MADSAPWEGSVQGPAWIAALIAQRWAECEAHPLEMSPEQILALAAKHDVLHLVAIRLQQAAAQEPNHSCLTNLWHANEPIWRRHVVTAKAQAMLMAQAAFDLCEVMHQDAMDALILKGAALSSWLYSDPADRACDDIDVLVRDERVASQLAARLVARGYERLPSQGAASCELQCRRTLPSGLSWTIDVHWGLVNLPVIAQAFRFESLYRLSCPLPGLGPGARGLAAPAALLHACLHRAANTSIGEIDKLKWVYDIHLLAQAMDEPQWMAFAHLCVDKGFVEISMEALQHSRRLLGTRLHPDAVRQLQDRALKDRIRLRDLRRPLRMAWLNACALPGWRTRLNWLRSTLLPPREFLAYLYNAPQASLIQLYGMRCRRLLLRLGAEQH